MQQQQRNTRGELLRLPFVCYDYENNAVYLLPPFQAMLHAKITGLSPTRWMYKNLLHGKCQNVISNKRIEIYNRVWFHLSHNQVHLCSKFQPLIWLIFIFSLNYIYTSIYSCHVESFRATSKVQGGRRVQRTPCFWMAQTAFRNEREDVTTIVQISPRSNA